MSAVEQSSELIIPGSGRAVVVRVAAAFGLSPDDLCGGARFRPIVRARQAAVWLLRQQDLPAVAQGQWGLPGQTRVRSFPEIGAVLGGIDHSSAIYGFHKCAAVMARDPAYRAVVLRLAAGLPPLPAAPPGLDEPVLAVPRTPRRVAELPPRTVKPKSALADDDAGAVSRYNGTRALLAAITRDHGERPYAARQGAERQ